MPAKATFITLTTDFGYKDPYVGILKGVILDINPHAGIIDISHGISPQDIMEASLLLRSSFRYFPHGTIHVAVVDPGVGSNRRPIIISTQHYYFVGPDNGIFSFVYEYADEPRVLHLNATHYFLPAEDSTFDGRDIFAPIAAWLSKGIDLENFGEPINDYVKIPFPKPKIVGDNILEGEIISIDRFGNASSNILSKDIKDFLKSEGSVVDIQGLKIMIKGKEISGLSKFYAQALDKGPSAIINSSGLLEIYIYRGNAAKVFELRKGDKIGLLISR